MSNRLGRIALVGVVAATAISTAGCASINSKRVMAAVDTRTAPSTAELKDLSETQKMELADILTGEIQTVYPSDSGLARVYGQVANLGQKPYSVIRFDIVAKLGSAEQDSDNLKVVGTFTVDDGLKPGEIKPFDVQTTATMGDVKNLVVRVGATQ